MYTYEKSPNAIYKKSFATVREETNLSQFSNQLHAPIIRMIHACGMIDLIDDIKATPNVAGLVRLAIQQGGPVLCDCEMVKAGIITRNLPGVDVIVTLNDASVPEIAADLKTTRSAAAVELWKPVLGSAVVVIGNAPTALFHLLEILEQGAPKPAAILGFPVGFVGAVESKEALAQYHIPYFSVHGRRGGSSIASACFNGIMQ